MTETLRGLQNSQPLLACKELHKSYFKGTELPVLRGIDFQIEKGEFVCIIGNSGSGKSTLLHCLGTLDTPSSGSVHYQGQRIDDQPRSVRDHFRNHVVGYVFQSYHLLPELSTLENVMTSQLIRCSFFSYLRQRGQLKQKAKELLCRVGLGHRLTHKPNELSGGELQRAAIARALLSEPEILLADEPTGNLDPETGENVFNMLLELRREIGLTVLMVTHNHSIAARADRTLNLIHGTLGDSSTEPYTGPKTLPFVQTRTA